MRNPSDLPPDNSGPGGPRRPQFRFQRPSKSRIVVTVVLAAIVVLFLSARSLSSFFVNVLWFDSLGRSDVYWGILWAKIQLAVIFTLGFAAVLWLNLLLADRLAPLTVPNTAEDQAIRRVREALSKRRGLIRLAISLGLGIMVGAPAASHWQQWLLFRHHQAFAVSDPLFKVNVGFYVFRLPFAEFVVSWAFGALIFVVLLTVIAHFLNGSIRPQDKRTRISPQAKVHISVLLAGAVLIRGVNYWLSRFNLTSSERGVVRGALYTDIKAQLPATNLMILVSVAVALLLLWNIRQRGWRLPALAVGLWVVVAVVAGAVYPAVVQRFVVQPNVSTRELPYIARNITATKMAMNLDNVSTVNVTADGVSAADISADDTPLRDVRQLDPAQMRDRFDLDQGLSSFYRVTDLDVDRYSIDGRMQQVMVAARELDPAGIPNRTWVSQHLLYTHGCGVVAAPASVVTSDGRPAYVDLKVTSPALYVGDGLGGYAIANTKQSEQVCPGASTSSDTKEVPAGIRTSGAIRKAALSVVFGEFNLLGSRLITSDSSFVWIRDVKQRVQKLAPFLSLESDPYAVVVDGRVKWVVDAFTTTSRYPYAQLANTDQLSAQSGLNHSFNYARNSVKAVVDATSGLVTFYVVDAKDPIVRAWQSVFPKMFRPVSEASPALVSHFRYPEDLFRVQTNIYGRYHFDDATLFFNRDAAWSVAQAPPGAPEATNGVVSTVPATGQQAVENAVVSDANVVRFNPYYTIFHAPDTKDSGIFAMIRPYVPFSADDSRKELRSFMVVSSDPRTYGKVTLYNIVSTPLPVGPATVAAEFESAPAISATITPLDQRGSRVTYGDLQLVALGKGFVYIRPMYVLPDGTDAKQLFVRKILGWYDGKAVIGDSVTDVVRQLFPQFVGNLGDRVGSDGGTTPSTTVPGSTPTTTPTNTGGSTPAELLARADLLFAQADAALAQSPPDFSTYESKQAQARELVRQALAALTK